MDIKVPNLGEGIETGEVLEVLVSVGDTIEVDDGIVELSTDKATVIVPAESAGKVTAVQVKEGDDVAVGAVMISIEPSDSTVAAAPTPAPTPEAAPAPEPTPAPAPEPAATPEPVQVAPAAAPAEPAPPSPPPVPVATPAAVTSTGSDAAASPAMRRLAREVGVDLAMVLGTGPNGRITREDVLGVVRQQSKAGSASKTAAIPAGTETDSWGVVRVEKMTKIRKVIATKMHQSWTTCPRVTNFDDADVTDLEEFRQNSKQDYAAQGIKLTSMPFVIKAVAMALKQNPSINASIDPEAGTITYKDYVNIGIAIDTDRGLMVPSLRNVDQKSIPEIARELQDLIDRVLNGTFSVDELRGGTFSISNLGSIGGTYSTPIINHPETAILLLGRSRKMPVVRGDEIVARLMMPLSLSYDHRLIDGGTAARFLNSVIGFLSAPSRILLAP